MSYVVIARKWRPQQLDELLGQEHLAQTLKNAIHRNRVAHAFLFSGPRGCGKTSAARILAKALCCTATGGINPEPCGVCPSCTQITEGRSTDVFEIDAASHTGVDDIREIIDNVRHLPASARFKIYVIDEVHMLSRNAFNALLKTLEEPPEHAKFILATTDPQKLPVTILSRCQRYDFRRIPIPLIAERLQQIMREDGILHDPEALLILAREADGSMRDAQSLLEQVLAFAGDRKLDAELMREALGVVDSSLLEATLDSILSHQPGEVFEHIDRLYQRGLDFKRFGDALITYTRDLLVARVMPAPEALLERSKDEVARLVETAKAHSPKTYERLFEELCRVVESASRSNMPRFTLEVGLAGLAEAPPEVSLEELQGHLRRLEGRVSGVSTQPGAGDRAPALPRPRPREPQRRRSAPSAASQSRDDAEDDAHPSEDDAHPAATSALKPDPISAKRGEGKGKGDGKGEGEPQPTSLRAPEGLPRTQAEGTQKPSNPAKPPVFGEIDPRFVTFVNALHAEEPPMAALLSQVRCLQFSEQEIRLEASDSFTYPQLAPEQGRLQERLQKALSSPKLRLQLIPGDQADPSRYPTLDELRSRAKAAYDAALEEAARAHPRVRALQEHFQVETLSVRIKDSQS